MSKDNKERLVESEDKNGDPVKVLVKTPNSADFKQAQVEYNKSFRSALDSGALLRQRLSDYMIEQGIWSEEKQKKSEEYARTINGLEDKLRMGGIKLSEAKEVALELRRARAEFQLFLAEKNSLDTASAEGQADNARFAKLVRLCVLDPNTRVPILKRDNPKAEEEAYNASGDEPWLVEASGELANMLYGLDPDYHSNLEENKFLREYNFVNENDQFINNDGHPVDSEGRLIDEEGRYVAYRSKDAEKAQDKDQRYFVNRSGEELVMVLNKDGEEEWVTKAKSERKPFLDDDGNPVLSKSESVAVSEEDSSEEPAPAKKPTRKKRATKTES
jgi:hypothetical protein